MVNKGWWLLGSLTGRSKQRRFQSLGLQTVSPSLEGAVLRLTSFVPAVAEVSGHLVLEILGPR